MTMYYDPLKVKDPTKGYGADKKLTVTQHEKHHGVIAKNWWNKLKNETDPFDGIRCKPCGTLAGNIVTATAAYYNVLWKIDEYQFDVDAYDGKKAKKEVAMGKKLVPGLLIAYNAAWTAFKTAKCEK